MGRPKEKPEVPTFDRARYAEEIEGLSHYLVQLSIKIID